MLRFHTAAPDPARGEGGRGGGFIRQAGRLGDAIVLAGHRLATAVDAAPAEFGAESPVDETDARAVRREWIRCLRLWASYNPEEVFALKVGAALLALAIVGLWAMIGLLH